MGMPLDDILDLTVDRSQRANQKRHPRCTRDPFGSDKPLRAFQSGLAGKSLGDVELIRVQDIHAEKAVALQQRPR